ncbi:hypothetical protein [Streptomyces sp. NPDC127036]|uniref:hypothetical protein n=1 Tax=Streptomyces sp. NPDC127036 TaxID=3347112 RepID=UPI003668FAD6
MTSVTSPSQQTSRRLVFANCRLGRSDLDRMFAVASEGITGEVSVATQRHDTRYEAGTLTALMDSLTAANAPGDLNNLSNITMHAFDMSNGRGATIAVDTERTVVSVEGTDATWVLGQAARLEMLIKQSGGLLVNGESGAQPPMPMAAFLISASWLLIVAGTLWFLSVLDPKYGHRFGTAFVPLVLGPSIILSIVAKRFKKRANRPVLNVSTEVSRGSWWNLLSSGDKIVFVGVAVAAIGVLVTVILGTAQIVFG